MYKRNINSIRPVELLSRTINTYLCVIVAAGMEFRRLNGLCVQHNKLCVNSVTGSFFLILVNDQLDAQFFFRICLFHISTCFEHSCAHHQQNSLYQYIWYISLYVRDRLVCRFGFQLSLHTRRVRVWVCVYMCMCVCSACLCGCFGNMYTVL
jgi:hypothetical protein